MSEPRDRTLAPPPRHPAARPPSPHSRPHSNILNVPPRPVHPSHPPLPTWPPPSPRQDTRSEYFGSEPILPQPTSSLDVPHTHIQKSPPVPPNCPDNLHPFSEDAVGSTPSFDARPVEPPVPHPQHQSISPELLPPASPASSFSSIKSSQTAQQPLDHARQAGSLTSDSAYEATLSEKELRDLYDDEEIDRFLRLFSVVCCPLVYLWSIDSPCPQFVNEVKLDDRGQSTVYVEPTATDNIIIDDDDKDWISLNEAGENPGLQQDAIKPQTVSERIAQVRVMQGII